MLKLFQPLVYTLQACSTDMADTLRVLLHFESRPYRRYSIDLEENIHVTLRFTLRHVGL